MSSSLRLRRSVTNQIKEAARSGRASSGRARSPPGKRVASMQTPTFSMMSQTRPMLSCRLMAG
jgi:hypothetical protein